MTQQEFESRYGEQVSEKEFEAINDLYMTCGDDVDKDQFVDDLKRYGNSALLQGLLANITAECRGKEALQASCKSYRKQLEDMGAELKVLRECHKNELNDQTSLEMELAKVKDELAKVKEERDKLNGWWTKDYNENKALRKLLKAITPETMTAAQLIERLIG